MGESPTRQLSLQPEAIGAVMEVTKWLGNLAMFANCERNAKAKKLSRVRFSQPLGNVMTGRGTLSLWLVPEPKVKKRPVSHQKPAKGLL